MITLTIVTLTITTMAICDDLPIITLTTNDANQKVAKFDETSPRSKKRNTEIN